MDTRLGPALQGTTAGAEGKAIVERCVHCGFCNATCPTYQLLGDELDGPRGRIYLIKQVLEGAEPTARTQQHLDRCLTCRACETTCPSGVPFGRLLDIGRRLVDERVERPLAERLVRATLRNGLTSPAFAPALRAAQAVRPLLPASIRARVPRRERPGASPARSHPRRMLLLAGCVQPALLPGINVATARILDALGIELVAPAGAGCCGAIRHHLGEPAEALAEARRNIDAWWPEVEHGVEAIVTNASGCGAMVDEYGHLLRDDPGYAAKAARIVELARDVSEIVAGALATLAGPAGPERTRVAFHAPCTLQHAQRIRGVIEPLLAALGADVLPCADGHLCCGSAGTYSLLKPGIAQPLRDRKLAALTAAGPEVILSANVGCITHMAGASPVPVRHWIEWIAERLGLSSVS